MSIELRFPNISGNEKEQLVQMRGYLYQLVEQLQWALNNITTTGEPSSTSAQAPKVISAPAAPPLSPQVTFDKLKDLIINSADIVVAYYDKIVEKLNGTYFAESDFGTFVKNTQQIETKTSEYTEQQFRSLEAIITDTETALGTKIENGNKAFESSIVSLGDAVSGLGDSLSGVDTDMSGLREALKRAQEGVESLNTWVLETEASIRTGIIDERTDQYGNTFPVYGIEIGQIDTANGYKMLHRFARFTSGKLSFYDQNNTEIAYVSNFKLYITNAEITGNLKLGSVLFDTSKGLKLKWEERG